MPDTFDLARQQNAINRQLNLGIIFSLVWLFGLGSLISFVLGLRAMHSIGEDDQLRGTGRAWWCVIAGGIGTIFLICLVLAIVLHQLRIGGH
jgi:hypothetical protein